MDKYQDLTSYLLEHADPVIELSFSQLDALVAGGLPPSAKRHPAWWANSRASHAHAGAWLDAGRQAQPNFNTGFVRFPFGSERRLGPRSTPQRLAYRSMSTDTEIRDGNESQSVSPDLQVDWQRLGAVTLEGDEPVIPSPPPVPGVYRFTLVVTGADATAYVGESDNLAKRMIGYRRPGPTQDTNQRIQARIIETIRSDGSVELAVATRALLDGRPLNFGHKPARLLVENALLVHLAIQGAKVENL